MGTESWEIFRTDTQFLQKFVLQFVLIFSSTLKLGMKQGLEGVKLMLKDRVTLLPITSIFHPELPRI